MERPLTISVDGVIAYDEDGIFRQTHCVIRDITEQRRAEENLRFSEQRYRRLIDASDSMIFSINRKGVYEAAAGTRLADFGLRPEDVIGKTQYDIFPEDVARLADERNRHVFETGELAHFEQTFEFGGGERDGPDHDLSHQG